ncbi:hypothetical protein [Paenibacillus sp. N3.4]|uniref:hypothetical protein n=1 Tax=Paenibacillus sp. N3.4 TaxID=2603222 RepID=UPI0011C6EA37|nr:hypothetical protein [Paenibacillus sp. N3.4]TXK85260.1 hypothetical protein FU659_04570 [Paenibacillus sp. N3.4]
MIKARLAKSILEHEEGMNHLWIQFASIGEVKNAQIKIVLPAGVHRAPNLSHYKENGLGDILIAEPQLSHDILIEFFTCEPVSCGKETISIILAYTDKEGQSIRIENTIHFRIVVEEDTDEIQIDEKVVNKIKQLKAGLDESCPTDRIDYTPMKVFKIDPHPSSELEKKYRVDGLFVN